MSPADIDYLNLRCHELLRIGVTLRYTQGRAVARRGDTELAEGMGSQVDAMLDCLANLELKHPELRSELEGS